MVFAPERPPLRFVTPAGWPQPSPAWVARNQGWQPPVGWLPPVGQPGVVLTPAPPTWQFWVEDPVAWSTYRAPYAKPVHRTLLVGALMFAIGTVITVAGYLGELGQTFLILWGLIIFGAVRLVMGFINLRKVDQTARAALGMHARQVRFELDQSAYPMYLDRTASDRAVTGRPPMTLDEFAVARDAEPWTMPGYASAGGYAAAGVTGVSAPGVSWTADVPGSAPARRSRKVLWVGLAIGASFVVALAATITLAPRAATASGSNTDPSASGVTGNYAVADADWTIDDNPACGTLGDGCWGVRFTPEESCSALTLGWGFSKTRSGDEKAQRSTTISAVAGQTQTVLIKDDATIDPLSYIGLDSANCAG